MVRVSSNPIPSHVLNRIGLLLAREIASIRSKQKAEKFIDAFFTDTERIMLAKRFAVLISLEQGVSYNTISDVLHVSPSTTGRLQKRRQAGEFDAVLKNISAPRRGRKKNDRNATELTLEVLFRAGLPPMGRDRWNKTFEIIDAQRKRDEKRHTARKRNKRKKQ